MALFQPPPSLDSLLPATLPPPDVPPSDYVTVNTDKIQVGKAHNFATETGTDTAREYDILSLMHYGLTDFSTDGTETITPKAAACDRPPPAPLDLTPSTHGMAARCPHFRPHGMSARCLHIRPSRPSARDAPQHVTPLSM